jgi:hypothetical protein
MNIRESQMDPTVLIIGLAVAGTSIIVAVTQVIQKRRRGRARSAAGSVAAEYTPIEARGPMTASEAWAAVMRHAPLRRGASAVVLRGITSDESIDGHGRAMAWDFMVGIESRGVEAIATIEPCADEWENRSPAMRLRWVERPRGAGSGRAALSWPFKESERATRELADQGADWISGDMRMTLATGEEDGLAVWRTESRGRRYTTPFAA